MPRSFVWLLALGLLGCGAAPVAETTTSTLTASIVIETTNGYRVEGDSVWEGRYLCPQGVTGLTLELSGRTGSEVGAVFHFYAVPENPGVPNGSYRLAGVVRGDGTIDLLPERWIEQPEGYVMVGMTGFLDRTTGVMRGRITDPACDLFDLRRVR
jgi:hypothetical protein